MFFACGYVMFLCIDAQTALARRQDRDLWSGSKVGLDRVPGASSFHWYGHKIR